MEKEKKMDMEDILAIFTDKYNVELTEELMRELVEKYLWDDIDSLREMKCMGAKWNTKRNSIIM